MRVAGFLIAIVAIVSLVAFLLPRTDGVPAAQAQQGPNVTITKVDSPDPVMAGNNITYTITISNPDVPEDSVSVSDTIPAGTTFVSWIQTSGPLFALSGPTLGVVTATIANFATGQTATFQLVVNVPPSTANGTIISNTAVVDFCFDSPACGTNSAAAQTTVFVPTVTPTVTRTVTPTVTSTTTPTATATKTPTVRPNVGAFLEGASGTERNLQRAGVTNDPRAPLQPVPAQAQVAGTTNTPGGSPAPAGVLRPPSTGDAGLVED